ncbi:hypothetical protein FOPG_09814 [Fusarium oxysporum f. sp. conglutinans race 2 54008]|uniref:Galactosyl transferase GMA12/MNN10 family protein n=3 Tax=Fusarium oxysporum f. sp. conglutinans TaxID=100902 RepID=A0A8H6LC02_FUSOX|nr:hypothetical protein FOXB_11334 [Fusarium oxysporum f. sp. conglutinans Fo5176]EXL75164.1 hypothetical protein FOPG_09814 [Fusarium oxysporum f. sp. conglutinans race 2 54008]KAF6514712.1 hypothetical protein HZS61_005846 [Fusarium oxysporum f. sp. conglutinans]KAG7003235.1 putative alpha-1,2-galactosyltransferase [Fusarium oxysporum f. sp. conglutinans]KAI8400292.1 hypothetical protein FOFC_19125 [Fusarium oxysporum]
MLQLKRLPWSTAAVALKAVIVLFGILLCYQAYTFYGEWSWPKSFTYGTTQDPVSLVHPHGGSQCLPSLNSSLLLEAKTIRNSCRHMPPYPSSDVRIGRVTAHFGSVQEHYQKALRTHVLHSMIHDNDLEVMCTPVVDSLWNKPAFILSLLLDEMVKPAQERLEWLFWVDRDTLILDQCRPLSSFLSPHDVDESDETEDTDDSEPERSNETKHDDIHLLVTNDWNGLNNGVFFVRVNQWAIELFSDIAAFRYYRPNVSLPFTEQSAMEIIMNEPKFKANVQVIPQEWFNTYPKGSPTDFVEKADEDGLEDYHARRGDFLLHFAGRGGRDKLINEWTEMLEGTRSIWSKEEVQRNATTSIRGFWSGL